MRHKNLWKTTSVPLVLSPAGLGTSCDGICIPFFDGFLYRYSWKSLGTPIEGFLTHQLKDSWNTY